MDVEIGGCPLGAKCEEVKTVNGKQVIVRCPWYIRVSGKNVNTDEDTDDWGCAIAWMPALLINTANEARKGASATESFRNEMVKIQQVIGHPVSDIEQIENQESETAEQIS